jgi:hypothetical protein
LQAYLRSHLTVGQDLGFELSVGIENKRNRRLFVRGKLVDILVQVGLINLRLVLVNLASEIVAQLLRFAIKVAGKHRCVE